MDLRLPITRSMRNHQLRGVKQQKARVASFFPAAVIADDHDSLLAVDHRGADPFGVLEALQAGRGDTASRLTRMAAPEPELEVPPLAGDRTTDDKIPAERGNPGHAAYSVSSEIKRFKNGQDPGWLGCFKDC